MCEVFAPQLWPDRTSNTPFWAMNERERIDVLEIGAVVRGHVQISPPVTCVKRSASHNDRIIDTSLSFSYLKCYTHARGKHSAHWHSK